eukprot:1834983-Prymnesium_polylepis.1
MQHQEKTFVIKKVRALGPREESRSLCGAAARPREVRPRWIIGVAPPQVSYMYQYVGGAYRMTGKGASVKETSREAVESFMTRMLPANENEADANDRV